MTIDIKVHAGRTHYETSFSPENEELAEEIADEIAAFARRKLKSLTRKPASSQPKPDLRPAPSVAR